MSEEKVYTIGYDLARELLRRKTLSELPPTMSIETARATASDWAEELLGDQYRRLSTSALTSKLATFRATELACIETLQHGIDPDSSETRVRMLTAGAKVSLVSAILRERGLDPETAWAALRRHRV